MSQPLNNESLQLLESATQYADIFVQSGLFDKRAKKQTYKAGKEELIVKILLGFELGIQPTTACMNIFTNSQNGRLEMTAGLKASLICRNPEKARFVNITPPQERNNLCRLQFYRNNSAEGEPVEYTLSEAQKGAAVEYAWEDGQRVKRTKFTWQLYPADMLFARCVSRLARQFCPELLLGIYTVGESEDMEDAAADKMAETPAQNLGPSISTGQERQPSSSRLRSSLDRPQSSDDTPSASKDNCQGIVDEFLANIQPLGWAELYAKQYLYSVCGAKSLREVPFSFDNFKAIASAIASLLLEIKEKINPPNKIGDSLRDLLGFDEFGEIGSWLLVDIVERVAECKEAITAIAAEQPKPEPNWVKIWVPWGELAKEMGWPTTLKNTIIHDLCKCESLKQSPFTFEQIQEITRRTAGLIRAAQEHSCYGSKDGSDFLEIFNCQSWGDLGEDLDEQGNNENYSRLMTTLADHIRQKTLDDRVAKFQSSIDFWLEVANMMGWSEGQSRSVLEALIGCKTIVSDHSFSNDDLITIFTRLQALLKIKKEKRIEGNLSEFCAICGFESLTGFAYEMLTEESEHHLTRYKQNLHAEAANQSKNNEDDDEEKMHDLSEEFEALEKNDLAENLDKEPVLAK